MRVLLALLVGVLVGLYAAAPIAPTPGQCTPRAPELEPRPLTSLMPLTGSSIIIIRYAGDLLPESEVGNGGGFATP